MPSPRKPWRETRFANARLNPIGVELMTLKTLQGRVDPGQYFEAERIGFFMILVVTAGPGEHSVDFERFKLQAGHVVFVRPGQVQQWLPARELEADVLLIDPAAMHPTASTLGPSPMSLLRHDEWPIHFKLGAKGLATWRLLATLLRKELDQPTLDALSAAMARELLVCLMIGISRSAVRSADLPTTQAGMVRRFQRELDARVHSRPSVAELASLLRVSTSTLTRSCHDVLGHSAKVEVDRRVALEAQRLLVHSTSTSVAIGEFLGFSEPTNFVKFFRRSTGATPEAFRRAHRLQGR